MKIQILRQEGFCYWLFSYCKNNEICRPINVFFDASTFSLVGNLTLAIYKTWDSEIEDWVNSSKYQVNYDANENLSEEFAQTWDNNKGEWTTDWKFNYFYSEFEINNIHETSNSLITIYPNPATDKIRVLGDITLKNANISIYSISGNRIKKTLLNNQGEIDIKDLPKGVYFMDMRTLGRRFVKSFIKE